MDIHARIQKFLQHDYPSLQQEGAYNKAGVVPFMRNPYRYYVMKPVARHAHLAAPKFQICKGTREGEEKPIETALREGIEELGLKLENIKRLFDLGPYGFSSAATGKGKEMLLFAAEMASPDFSGDVEPTTAECAWLTLEEFGVVGREDHGSILQDIENRLKE